jgi:hypothetical protein
LLSSRVLSVDELIKAAARFEVLGIKTHEPDLEEVFLAYYRTTPMHLDICWRNLRVKKRALMGSGDSELGLRIGGPCFVFSNR